MNHSLGNIYKQARKASGLTQEAAAEYLKVSTETLSKYENGKVTPTDSMVVRMVHIYETPHLAVQHMETNELAKLVMPKIDVTDFVPAVLVLRKAIREIQANIDMLGDIASNNQVSDDEYEDWCKVEEILQKVAKSAYGVIFSIKDKA